MRVEVSGREWKVGEGRNEKETREKMERWGRERFSREGMRREEK